MSTGAQPRYTRHVDAVYPLDALSGLLDASENVQALLRHPGFAEVKRVLEREIGHVDRDLDSLDIPLTQAQYAMAHGRRGALRAFEEAAAAIVSRAEKRRQEQAQKHEGDGEASPGR